MLLTVANSIMKKHCCDDVLRVEYKKELELRKETEANLKASNCEVKCLLSLKVVFVIFSL